MITARVEHELKDSQDPALLEATGRLIKLETAEPENEFGKWLLARAEEIDPDGHVRLPPAVPDRIRVAPDVQASKLVTRIDPVCPAGEQCREPVRYRVIIGTDGKIQNAQLISGRPKQVAVANAALKAYAYQPTVVKGTPVEVATEVNVAFQPPKD